MTKYILSENKLRKIINETIVNILTEELSDAYKQINDGMWKRTYGVRPNLNKKKWQRRFDRDSYIPEPLTDFEQECEDAAEEFLNTPNAARDFKNFPRQSAHRNHDYFDYSNNRKLKVKRQENKQKRIEQDIQIIKGNYI